MSRFETVPSIIFFIVRPSVFHLLSLRSCQIAILLDYESEGTGGVPVFAHTFTIQVSCRWLVSVEANLRAGAVIWLMARRT